MNALKAFWSTTVQAAKQVCLLPRNIVHAITRRQQRSLANENEAERLDRIRNPSKYLGK